MGRYDFLETVGKRVHDHIDTSRSEYHQNVLFSLYCNVFYDHSY